MTNSEKEIFDAVLLKMQVSYPIRKVCMKGTLVYVDNEAVFNTDGFNLLFNLKRLVGALEDELI